MKISSLLALSTFVIAGCTTNSPTNTAAQNENKTVATEHARKAHAMMEQGQYDEAAALLDKTLKLDADNASASFDRAQLRFNSGNVRGALDDLNKAVSLAPDNARYLGMRCVVLVADQQKAAGLADCQKALAAPDAQANALTSRGQARLLLGENREALADFEAALASNPNHMRALYGRGVAKLRLGNAQGIADKTEATTRLKGAARDYQFAGLS